MWGLWIYSYTFKWYVAYPEIAVRVIEDFILHEGWSTCPVQEQGWQTGSLRQLRISSATATLAHVTLASNVCEDSEPTFCDTSYIDITRVCTTMYLM